MIQIDSDGGGLGWYALLLYRSLGIVFFPPEAFNQTFKKKHTRTPTHLAKYLKKDHMHSTHI